MDSRSRPRRWTVGRLPPLFSSQRSRTVAIAAALVVVLVAVVGAVFLPRYLPVLTDPVALREGIAAYGPLAPLAFVCVQALQVLVAPIPGQVLGLASGYLFGAVAGTAYSLLGATIGSVIAFALARRFGRPFVEAVMHPDVVARFDGLVERDGALGLFLVFLIPGLPDDAICLLGGLTPLSIPRLVAISIAGRLPGYFLLNVAGAGAAAGNPATVVGAVAAMAGGAVLALWQRERLLAWLREA